MERQFVFQIAFDFLTSKPIVVEPSAAIPRSPFVQFESDLATVTLTVARDLGGIHVVEFPHLNPSEGDIWYGFRTTRDALINLWAQNSDDVTITLYDQNLNELDEWTPGNGHQRLGWSAEKGQKFYFRLTRIIQEADIVCYNINERQYLWLSYPKHRVLKPEAQAKGSAQFSSRVLKLQVW